MASVVDEKARPAPGPVAARSDARTWRWPGLLLTALFFVGVMGALRWHLRDVDVFWHVRLGGELLHGVSIYEVGRDWSYANVPGDHWVSTQWIVEILFSWLQTLWGWDGLIWYRSVTTGLALVTAGWVVFRGPRTWASVVAFLPSAFTLMEFSQERPQQVSFILLPFVGYWWSLAVRDGRVPKWWWILLGCAAWANCHGLWIMAPVAIFLALAGRFLDNGRDDPVLNPLLIGFIASLVGGSITPIGPLNLLTPISFAGATSEIQEWDPTDIIDLSSLGLIVTALLLFIAWARGNSRPSRAEVLYGVLIFAFGCSAARNIAPAVIMLAAPLAWRLGVAFKGRKRQNPDQGLSTIAKPAAIAMAGAGVVLGGVLAAGITAIDPEVQPIGLVEKIAAQPTSQRVLNAYNISGLVLWYARPAASRSLVQVGIDGRADRYGGAYIKKYLDMERGRPGWDTMVAELNPTIALLPEEDALTPLLKSKGWKEAGVEAKYVLLTPP